MIQLRAYQQRIIDQCREHFRAGRRRIVVQAPCRSGKTYTFGFMAHAAASKGKRVLVLAHREALVEQASNSFSKLRIEHGLILSGRSSNTMPVQIGMIGTVARRLDRIHAPDMIVIDEGHRSLGKQYRSIIDAFPAAHVLPFTATPARTDGRGLGEIAEALVQGPQPLELIESGDICRPRLFVPEPSADLSGIRNIDSVEGKAKAARALDRPHITGDAIAHYRRYASGLSFVCFCSGIEHAVHVAEQFTAAGIPTLSIDGTNSQGERDKIMGALASKSVTGITTTDLISEGVDLPSVWCTIHLRRTDSLIVYIQQSFRPLTPEPGKTHGIIIDAVNNFATFGWPHADREWSLDGRCNHNKRAAENTVAVRRCKACFMIYEPHIPHCPFCGAEAERGSRRIEQRDGDLVEITDDMLWRERIASASYKDVLRECATPEEIKAAAKARGYKPGWAIRRVMETAKVSPVAACKMLGYSPRAAAFVR